MSATAYLIANMAIIAIMFITVVIVNYSKKKKEDTDIDLLDYLAGYSDRIIVIAEQVVQTLKITQTDYEKNPVETKKKMLEGIVDSVMSAADELDIDLGLIKLVDRAILVDAIYTLIEEKLPEIIADNLEKDETADNTVEVIDKGISGTTNISNTLDNFYTEDTDTNNV